MWLEQAYRCERGNTSKFACYCFFNRDPPWRFVQRSDLVLAAHALSLDRRSKNAARKAGNWGRYANSSFIMSTYTPTEE